MIHSELQGGRIAEQRSRYTHQSSSSESQTVNLPFVLSSWVVITFITLLGDFLTIIVLLLWCSHSHGIYESAWVYQIDVTIGNNKLGGSIPSAIIPTLLDVMIGLW